MREAAQTHSYAAALSVSRRDRVALSRLGLPRTEADRVLREAVFKHRAGMIEDQRIGLAGRRAQRAPSHLAIKGPSC